MSILILVSAWGDNNTHLFPTLSKLSPFSKDTHTNTHDLSSSTSFYVKDRGAENEEERAFRLLSWVLPFSLLCELSLPTIYHVYTPGTDLGGCARLRSLMSRLLPFLVSSLFQPPPPRIGLNTPFVHEFGNRSINRRYFTE